MPHKAHPAQKNGPPERSAIPFLSQPDFRPFHGPNIMMIKAGLLASGSDNLPAPSRFAGETVTGLTAMRAV
jgi:hypothetical protein